MFYSFSQYILTEHPRQCKSFRRYKEKQKQVLVLRILSSGGRLRGQVSQSGGMDGRGRAFSHSCLEEF